MPTPELLRGTRPEHLPCLWGPLLPAEGYCCRCWLPVRPLASEQRGHWYVVGQARDGGQAICPRCLTLVEEHLYAVRLLMELRQAINAAARAGDILRRAYLQEIEPRIAQLVLTLSGDFREARNGSPAAGGRGCFLVGLELGLDGPGGILTK